MSSGVSNHGTAGAMVTFCSTKAGRLGAVTCTAALATLSDGPGGSAQIKMASWAWSTGPGAGGCQRHQSAWAAEHVQSMFPAASGTEELKGPPYWNGEAKGAVVRAPHPAERHTARGAGVGDAHAMFPHERWVHVRTSASVVVRPSEKRWESRCRSTLQMARRPRTYARAESPIAVPCIRGRDLHRHSPRHQ